MKKPLSAGFTMIELLVVTTIIIVLTTIGLVSFRQAGQSARNGRRKADLETVRQALLLYRSDNGSYPSGSSFNTLVTTQLDGYLNVEAMEDPKNTGTYVYTYSSNGTTFTLTARLEPDADTWSVTNP